MRYVGDYIGAVEAEKRKISESLVNGNAMTFDAYQRLVGQHQGLVKALEILNDLLREEDDDN
jgi:uncharacterized protein (UPF0254 family)